MLQKFVRLDFYFTTCSGSTWQNMEIFSLTAVSNGVEQRQTICQDGNQKTISDTSINIYLTSHRLAYRLTRSGDKPSPRSSRTLFCVGLVFCSPVELG